VCLTFGNQYGDSCLVDFAHFGKIPGPHYLRLRLNRCRGSYFKLQCQSALNTLDDWDYFCFRGGLDNPTAYLENAALFLKIATDQRRAVEDAGSDWGYNVMTDPYDLKRH
jgi:hypothetical protein